MNADALEIPCDINPHAVKQIWLWGGLFWGKLTTCENYEIFPQFGICKGLKKFFAVMLERHGETGNLFDNGLFVAFILLFVAFLITSIYTIFAEDKKSLKEISNKVRKTTDAIVSILRSFWTLREVKISNLKLEAECKKILKMKLPAYLIDGVKMENLRSGAFLSVAEFACSSATDEEPTTEIVYTQEEEFPVEGDWIPPDEKVVQINHEIGLDENGEPNKLKNDRAEEGTINERSSSPKRRTSARNKFSSLSSGDILSKTETDSSGLEIIPEINVSDGDEISPKKKWIGKRLKTPGSGRITIPPYPKEFQMEIKKRSQNSNENNESNKGGIFEQRRQNIEKTKRTKSFERTPYRSDWDSQSSDTRVMPRRSGIFNRSTHKIPLPSARNIK